MDPTIIAGIVAAIVAIVSLVVASVVSHAHLIRRCVGLSFTVACALLLIPGLNVVGLLLLVVSGLMLMMGKCQMCDKVQ